MNRKAISFVTAVLVAGTVLARNKTNDSPAGAPLIPVPHPVGFLSPEEEARTLNLPAGFHAEVVASEPMIQHPIEIAFDGDGRMWVVEMRGYMPNVSGTGEDKPIGRISILEDTDGDGKMDKATVFLDHLVLPRSLGFFSAPGTAGVLVGVPPKLYDCRDTKGDGVCDRQTVVSEDYGVGGNPEHLANSPTQGMDNWIYSADYPKRFRLVNGKWTSDPIPDMGQWGLSQDDFGRWFHDSNSDQIRAALYPPAYATRNSRYRAQGANAQMQRDQTVYPSHDTAENRGYSKNFLRPDGTLREFTAACGPCVYRGDLFGPGFEGNVFLCEPSANVVRRNVMTAGADGLMVAHNAYEKKEFIASTYERFRPVNLASGPDGALYVVDMHHGLIQHTAYLTEYNEKQYLGRELDKYLGTGRIFRIVPDGVKLPATPHLSKATTGELVELLSHPNGWQRDTAQRLLIQRNDKASIPLLKAVVTSGTNALARLHAIWTLDGLARLDQATVVAALSDKDAHVRAAAIRLCEPLLASRHRAEILPALLKLSGDADPVVRLQWVLTGSEIGTPEADGALAKVLGEGADNPLLRDAALTGLHGRELEFLKLLGTDSAWAKGESAAPVHTEAVAESTDADRFGKGRGGEMATLPGGKPEMVRALAACVLAEGSGVRIGALIDLAADRMGAGSWQATPMLAGVPEPDHRKGMTQRSILLKSEPRGLGALAASDNAVAKAGVKRLEALVHWPGEPGYVPPPPPVALTAEQKARFEVGRGVYTMLCGTCHKPDGLGQDGMAPPLLESEWALGPESRVVRIVLGGLHGPITVGGRAFNLDMPSLKVLDDEKIASVLTFVRRNWDHTAGAVSPEVVAKIRAQTKDRQENWTERELLNVK